MNSKTPDNVIQFTRGKKMSRRADEGYKSHILEHGSYEEKQALFAFEAGDEAVQEHKVKAQLRKDLLAMASRKEPRFFHELDGFDNCLDSIINADDDGDLLMGGGRWELRSTSNPVRVQIHESAKREDVLRLLEKIYKWIENDPDLLSAKPTYPKLDDNFDAQIPF
ncbi:MAG: hypothetical protein ACXWTK_07230 [Methylobacter sp.]